MKPFFVVPQTPRPESNLTGRFGSTNVCARRTMPTSTATRWTSIYLRRKKPKPRPSSWWGYTSPHVLHSDYAQLSPLTFSDEKKSRATGTLAGNWPSFWSKLPFLPDKSKSRHAEKWRTSDCCHSGLSDRSVRWRFYTMPAFWLFDFQLGSVRRLMGLIRY